jgi:hypothetical protein
MADQPMSPGSSGGPGGDDAAARAKQMAGQALAQFKGFEPLMQLYLAALAVVVLCTLIFNVISFDVNASGTPTEGAAQAQNAAEDLMNSMAPSAVQVWQGKLTLLGGLAGIGIFLWATFGARRDAWIPLALVGSAGLCLLMLLLLAFDAGGLGGLDVRGAPIDLDLTLLGWWLPFLASAAATAASAKRILKA